MIEAAELFGGALEEPVDVFGAFHVRLHGDRSRAEGLDLADRGGRHLRVALIVDDDCGTFARERERERATDPARAAGDQRDLPLEPAHAPAPSMSSRAMTVFWISFVPSSK